MANPTKANFTTDCYSLLTITPRQQKALMVYAKTLILKGLGGTDYSTALTTTLFTDTATATIGLDQARRDAARVKIGFVAATTLAQTFPSDISGKMAKVNQLVEVPDEQLDNMLVYLDQFIAQVI